MVGKVQQIDHLVESNLLRPNKLHGSDQKSNTRNFMAFKKKV